MKLLKLQLENFRNYDRYEHIFDPGKPLTVVSGPNGKGKTNLLEAVYLLSLGKSFRSVLQDDLINWEMDYFRCLADVETENDTINLEVGYSTHPSKKKIFKRNQVDLKNSSYIGNLLTVLFHPEDLNILYLSPSLRRRYMDVLLSQCDREYFQALLNYIKVLKQRNALLDEMRTRHFKGQNLVELVDDLNAWNKEMAKHGSVILEKRIKLLAFLIKRLPEVYRDISGGEEEIDVNYESKIIETPEELDNLDQSYFQKLKDRNQKDILAAKTTAGPHRDDLKFYINGKEIGSSASRGEFRTLLLAIKLCEIEFIKQKTGENPVLLLDDVFSELDGTRQEKLLKTIKNCQAILTTTDLENIDPIAKKGIPIDLVEIK